MLGYAIFSIIFPPLTNKGNYVNHSQFMDYYSILVVSIQNSRYDHSKFKVLTAVPGFPASGDPDPCFPVSGDPAPWFVVEPEPYFCGS